MPATFEPAALTTGIGSLPYRDAAEAVDWVLRSVPDLPFWPQLPAAEGGGDMIAQFLEGFPALVEGTVPGVIDTEAPAFRDGCARLAADAAGGSLDPYGLSRAAAPGWHALVERLAGARSRPRLLKGQVTGPVTQSTTLTNRNRVPLFVAADAFEAVIQWATLKGLWQIREAARLGIRPVIFLDEPGLPPVLAGHSRTVEERALAGLRRVLASWREAGAVTGVHVCARVPWRPLFDVGADILSLDAAQHLADFLQEVDLVRDYVRAGGHVAWGVIPTASTTDDLDPHLAQARMDEALSRLAEAGLPRERVLQHSLFTPACGTGTLSIARSEAVFSALQAVARTFADQAASSPVLPGGG